MSFDWNDALRKDLAALKPSGIRKFFDLVDNMKGVVALTVGQPDFVTPWHIRDSAIYSLEQGRTYYTSNAGIPALRRGISDYLSRRFGLEPYSEDEIIVTVGGSEAIDLCIRATVRPGDEVIIPLPCFVCYAPLVKLAGGTPVFIETREEDEFKLKARDLKEKMTEKTRLVVLPYPANPTGAVMDENDLKEIADVIRNSDAAVLSDEIYAELTYGGRHVSISSLPGMRERTVICSGFSKAFAMTGWRLGYIAAPLPAAKQMLKLHQFAVMCAPTQSQFAALEAIVNGDEDIDYMRGEYDARRRLIVDGLRELGFPCFEPKGAFYVYPNISGYGLDAEKFCEKLLYEAGVAIVPGTAFAESATGFARISYAYSTAHITEALERIGKWKKTL